MSSKQKGGSLTPEQLEQYDREGYLVIPGLLTFEHIGRGGVADRRRDLLRFFISSAFIDKFDLIPFSPKCACDINSAPQRCSNLRSVNAGPPNNEQIHIKPSYLANHAFGLSITVHYIKGHRGVIRY